MRIIFMGTPEFAVPILRRITPHHNVTALFTQPDRPCGRGRELCSTPVKIAGTELGIDVYEPESLRDPQVLALLRRDALDVIVVAAYGKILPAEVLDIPRHGCINVHASLLPRHRGAAPVHHAILAGDEVTGVSIMLMEEGLDTGPVALQREVAIRDKTVDELTEELSIVGAEALSEPTLPSGVKLSKERSCPIRSAFSQLARPQIYLTARESFRSPPFLSHCREDSSSEGTNSRALKYIRSLSSLLAGRIRSL